MDQQIIDDLSKKKIINKYEASLLSSKTILIEDLNNYGNLITRLNNNFRSKKIEPIINIDKMVTDFMSKINWSGNQKSAIKKIFAFILNETTSEMKEDDYIFYLFGFAGTGKTYLITEIVRYLKSLQLIKFIKLAASTHQAVNILKSRFPEENTADSYMKDAQLEFSTIHHLLKLKNDYQINSGEKIFVSCKNKKLFTGNGSYLIFIDECSMISDKIAEIIFKEIKEELISSLDNKTGKLKKYIKLIFLGDPAQLPPVEEGVNRMLAKSTLAPQANIYIMRQIMRSSNQNIIDVSNHIRQWVFDSSPANLKDLHLFNKDGVKLFNTYDDIENSTWFKHYIKNCLTASKSSVILAWTNNCCRKYNEAIRMLLFKENKNLYDNFAKNVYVKGERLIFNEYYLAEENQCVFTTSEQIKVIEFCETHISTHLKNGLSLFDECIRKYELMPIINDNLISLLKDLKNKIDTTYDVWKLTVSKNNNDTEESIIYVLKKEETERLDINRSLFEKNVRKFTQDWDAKNTLFHLMKDEKTPNCHIIVKELWQLMHTLLINPFAQVSYGYCITVHKAQSVTISDVYVDTADILKNKKGDEAKKCLYTAVTRASTKLNLII